MMQLIRMLLPPSPWRRPVEERGPDAHELQRAIADLQELTREVKALARELKDAGESTAAERTRLRVVNRKVAGGDD